VPRGNFVHKKSQENFERRTLRRLIQIQDAHPLAVQTWLGFLQKYAYHGVGMKANVWEHTGMDVGAQMDREADMVKETVKERFKYVGRRKEMSDGAENEALVHDSVFKGAFGSLAPMGTFGTKKPFEGQT